MIAHGKEERLSRARKRAAKIRRDGCGEMRSPLLNHRALAWVAATVRPAPAWGRDDAYQEAAVVALTGAATSLSRVRLRTIDARRRFTGERIPEARDMVDLDHLDQVATGATTDDLVDMARCAHRLRRAIATLPGRERRLVVAHYFEERSLGSVAVEFGVSPARVSQLHQQVLGRLRDEVAL